MPRKEALIGLEPQIIPDSIDRMQREHLAIAVILTLATGCDNVAWEGLELRLKPPISPTAVSSGQLGIIQDLADEEQSLRIPKRPILLSGKRTGSTARLTAVGEVNGNSLAGISNQGIRSESPGDFSLELITQGSEWVLFSEGTRVGRMIAQEVSLDDSFCTLRPAISGIVELVSEASDVEQLIALPIDVAGSRSFQPYTAHRHNYNQRVASLALASEAIPSVGTEWPPSLLDSRTDIHAFQLPGEPRRAIAATFLYQDRVNTSPPEPGAYSLFVMGDATSGTYEISYMWYRVAESQGKGVPRYLDHIDWNGDGSEEVLLEILGSEDRWFAGLARQDGRWIRSFEDSCNSATTEK